jgi:hypothetical protein
VNNRSAYYSSDDGKIVLEILRCNIATQLKKLEQEFLLCAKQKRSVPNNRALAMVRSLGNLAYEEGERIAGQAYEDGFDAGQKFNSQKLKRIK